MHVRYFAVPLLFVCSTALARGYSDAENASIWQARQLAAHYADAKASASCQWTPAEPPTFADDLTPATELLDPALFARVATMVRQDQNAIAASDAVVGSPTAPLARRRLDEVNAQNLAILHRYFQDHDFPATRAIGDNGINALLLLVAHADTDLHFQKKVLEKMKAQVEKGGLPPYLPAILESIRPQVAAVDPAGDPQPSATSLDVGTETPRQCFYRRRPGFIEDHLRSHVSVILQRDQGSDS